MLIFLMTLAKFDVAEPRAAGAGVPAGSWEGAAESQLLPDPG